MRGIRIWLAGLGALAGLASAPAASLALPKTYECQRPVVTGVEVWGLHDVGTARACPVALQLFAWENAAPSHARALYGCRRPQPDEAGFPYLRLHSFRGWSLSLAGKFKLFTMSKGRSSFHVGGTDFPLNCT